MQRKFLQESSLNASAGNAEKSLNVDLSAKSRLIPFSTTAGMLGLYDLYVDERNACENYRMIFTVSPVCTNVLYNAITEPVYKEGSLSAISLVQTSITRNGDLFNEIFPGEVDSTLRKGTINQSGDSIDQIFALRDTEISHEKIGNFKYHCGYDIFNNHLLRTDDFNHVKLAKKPSGEGIRPINEETFNTIFDFVVDYSGEPVTRIIHEDEGPVTAKTTSQLSLLAQPIRMYQLDNIKTINLAFYDNLRTVDGWYGFYNTGYINIPNARMTFREGDKSSTEDISVNRILNNETPCSFIDLYPDRTLFSFIPKVNRYRKRLERNWDCTMVYPYKNDYDTFNRVMLNFSGTSESWDTWKGTHADQIPNAVRVSKARVTYNNVGDEIIEMTSLLRHTLQPGDTIRLFYTTSVYAERDYKEISRFSLPVQIVNIGDTEGNNQNRCFSVKLSDLSSFCQVKIKEVGEIKVKKIVTLDSEEKELSFFYRKIENGYDDNYYFRKFKKIKNYEYYSTDGKDINVDERELTYSQNKIAFAENIFGDRVAQVIFNDDICITGLRDNLGRPLSTLYFTTIKTNRGHKEWYEEGDISADTVEYSHCFGDVTSGLDLPEDDNINDYNVRKLYNVFSADCVDTNYSAGLEAILEDAPEGSYSGTPLPLESAITVSDFDEFFGDIVEFNRSSFKETTIEKVYHRFNTAQRECLKNKKYYDVHYDNLYGDIYDTKTEREKSPDDSTRVDNSLSGFAVSSYTINEVRKGDDAEEKDKFPGNISPEGYFYSPFYEVPIKELDDELQFVTTRRINFDPKNAETTVYTSSITFYDPETRTTEEKQVNIIKIVSPIAYDFLPGRPFAIFDVDKGITYRGHLSTFTPETRILEIVTENEISLDGLRGDQLKNNDSQYIISMLDDNAPVYGEYVAASGKLVWRGPKKMSDLASDSPLYNMPFTNGRNYIHRNINVFVRRQDPEGYFHLFRPSTKNPLRRFQIEGDARLDFGLIKYIIDSMVDAC